jgi:hypothetical protein
MATNRFIGVNYINDMPHMAVPPEHWLERLFDYDAELVVFPSRHIPFAYVLARRRRLRAPALDKVLENTITQPDTKLCLARGLAPVTIILRHSQGSWSIDNIIRSLQARDIWRHGGGDAYANKMDEADDKEESQRKAALRDDMMQRADFAWDIYKRRTGQRISSSGVATKGAPLSTKHPSGSTGGSGIVITG